MAHGFIAHLAGLFLAYELPAALFGIKLVLEKCKRNVSFAVLFRSFVVIYLVYSLLLFIDHAPAAVAIVLAGNVTFYVENQGRIPQFWKDFAHRADAAICAVILAMIFTGRW